MPLPNLSGKSFLSTSPTFDTYQSGADSYREKVKEKIQNSPRRSANYSDYSRSIDLSISKDESFRPVSRHRSINVNNNNSQLNETTNGYRLKSAANDPKNISRLKSARNRQIVFYNNNNNLDESIDNETNNNNNNLDLKKELNRRNNTRNRNFNTSPLVSDDDFSVNINKNEKQNRNYNNNNNQRYESIENFDEPSTFTNNNKQQSILSPMAKESLLKAPLITPRKSLQQKSNQKQQQQSELNFSDEPPKRHNNNNKSRSTNQFENSENEFISNSSSFEESKLNKLKNSRNLEMFSASRTNFKDDDTDSQTQNAPPVPVPRKREQTAKLLNNNSNNNTNFFNSNTENDFKIKRNNSAATSKLKNYTFYAKIFFYFFIVKISNQVTCLHQEQMIQMNKKIQIEKLT
jgi:hypothetical protein